MLPALAADLVVLLHAAFIAFAAAGALLALRWPRIALAQAPAAAWGAFVELAGRVCPLTPLEHRLRAAAGEAGYTGGFVEHYVLPVVYPEALTREVQLALGGLLLAANLAIYLAVWRRWRRSR